MSEEMQQIDPVTAAMLMGQIPDPCEPTIEISHKVLTRLMDVVEFGDQLERVEKDRLLAHLKDVLAEEQPELWAMHSPGPGEVHPMISKEEAERQQSELLALCKKQFPEIPITVNVIPSPFSPLEHFAILAGELSEQVTHLHQALDKKTAETSAPVVNQRFTPAVIDVLLERLRQVEKEGWTPEHDDQHANFEMADAAGCYAHSAAGWNTYAARDRWPWSLEWWKPGVPRRDLVKAGALILAEIERLDRASKSSQQEPRP